MNDRLKILRDSMNLSMEKFGARLGVGKSAINKLEKGENKLTEPMINLICKEFNISEQWFRTGTGPMERSVTFDEEVAMYTQDILMDVESEVASAIREFIVIYGKLDENSKSVMNRVFKEMAEARKSREES